MNTNKVLAIYRTLGMLGCLPYVLGIILVVGLVAWWSWASRDNHIEVAVNEKINITPAQVESIQSIGQWEFLSISDEELIDTVARGFFGNSELMRIYYGTLRLGIDLHKASPTWLTVKDDSVVIAVLPPIELLDHNFIDEARTQSFFENGKWTAKDRQRLYAKAYQKMLARCLTAANIRFVERNAIEQMTRLLHTMGFVHVNVTFENQSNTNSYTSH